MSINMTTKVLGSLLAILAIYLLATFYVAIKTLHSSPDQLFLSEVIKSSVVELDKDNIDKLKNEVEFTNIDFVVAVTKDKKAIYYLPGAKDYNMVSDQSALAETILQYASGSNLAFAKNCDMTHYKHGTCEGPTYVNGTMVAPAVCKCVLKN